MPIVRVEMWPGRTQEQKRKTAKDITDVIVANMGCPAQAVTVVFDEVSQENWAIGGQLSIDVVKDAK